MDAPTLRSLVTELLRVIGAPRRAAVRAGTPLWHALTRVAPRADDLPLPLRRPSVGAPRAERPMPSVARVQDAAARPRVTA
jgi:hypothetical protein